MAAHRYLKPEDIKKLDTFEFAPRALVDGYLAGRHRSRSRGASTEFQEYREYSPGDDPKLIDWRVFARTDRHVLRTYEEETNLECHLFVDSSASMGFSGASPISKIEYASFFAAALSYLVVRNGDRVSLQLFDDQVRQFFPPGSTGGHLNQILNALEKNKPGNETSLSVALKKSQPLLKRKGILAVISDFFDDPVEIFTALNPYIHRGFRIHLFHLLTPGELDLEQRGLTTYIDLENGEKLVAHPANLRAKYKAAIDSHVTALRELSNRRAVDYSLTRTDTHFFTLFDRLIQ